MTEMQIITIEEHLAGAPINVRLAKYPFKDAPYTAPQISIASRVGFHCN